jgi:hypothetical protein
MTSKTVFGQNTDAAGMKVFYRPVQVACVDCTVLQMSGDMEYEDGTKANIDTDAWFHHAALWNQSKRRHFIGCEPMTAITSLAKDIMFATGSERMPMTYLAKSNTIKSGYYVAPTDNFILLTELMNTADFPKNVFVTIETEYLPGKQDSYLDTQVLYGTSARCDPEGYIPLADHSTVVGKKLKIPTNGYLISTGKQVEYIRHC